MTGKLMPIDYIIFIVYGVIILSVGLFVSLKKKNKDKTAEDYFLAGKTLPWWAIGASLIAANISAEQFIGMSGSGFAIGLAMASYEWMGALTLVIVGKYFLPIFIKNNIFTIPGFVEKRFGTTLKTIMAVFWIGLYVFVNLTSVLYLGALALNALLGVPILHAIIGLALFAAAYSLYGGLSAVAWTDVIQVVMLIAGGVITSIIALNHVSEGEGVLRGVSLLREAVPGHFHLILDKSNPQFVNVPGISVLIGGLWVANFYYFGFNQYIIQRNLAAKSLKESQKGMIFASFLKLFIPLLVIIPGIAAYVLVNNPEFMSEIGSTMSGAPSLEQADKAYPWLLQFLPAGLKGVALAALTAAIVSSLASMLNSTATIFTMDIYVPYINKKAGDRQIIRTGRITAAVALVIAISIAPMLANLDQVFQYIQEYTGIVTPGILAVFGLGLFWKKATNKAATWGAVFSLPVAFALKVGSKDWLDGTFLEGVFPEIAFMNQMAYACIITVAFIMLMSKYGKGEVEGGNTIVVSRDMFKTSRLFNISAIIIIAILVFLYVTFW
jgi:SSS family solute:Na+ symporter